MITIKDKIIIYTDGACSGNQRKENKGGWGAVLLFNEHMKELKGGELNTTNQRMELTASIKALESLKTNDHPVEIISDSAYLVNCMNQGWYIKWQLNGWRNAKREPVENQDLWEKLIELKKKFNVTFHKVKGHSGDEYNERADKLAREGLKEQV